MEPNHKILLEYLKKNAIQTEPPKKYKTMLIHEKPKQIFTQLIYKDIPNNKIYIPHWGSVVLILSTQLLKDFPFYAVPVGSFKSKFEQAFTIYSGKDSDVDNTIIKSQFGNLDKIPNLTKLKHYINNTTTSWDNSLSFIHSHEILFNRDIPLDKYCIAIMSTESTHTPELAQLCKNHNIPYTKLPKRMPKGLNNFIDLIDKVIQ